MCIRGISTLGIMIGLVACAPPEPTASPSEAVPVTIGNHHFVVPVSYLREPLAEEFNAASRDLTKFPELRIPIDSEPGDVAELHDPDTFTLFVTPVIADTAPAIPALQLDAAAAWQQQLDYEERVVRQDGPARLTRIFSRSEFPFAWHFFKVRPDDSDGLAHWSARCQVPRDTAEMPGFTNVTCQTAIRMDNLEVLISFSGARIGCRDRIVKRAETLLVEWRSSA